MGNADTKLNFRKAVINLTTKTEPVEADDEPFWEQFWSDSVSTVQVLIVHFQVLCQGFFCAFSQNSSIKKLKV